MFNSFKGRCVRDLEYARFQRFASGPRLAEQAWVKTNDALDLAPIEGYSCPSLKTRNAWRDHHQRYLNSILKIQTELRGRHGWAYFETPLECSMLSRSVRPEWNDRGSSFSQSIRHIPKETPEGRGSNSSPNRTGAYTF